MSVLNKNDQKKIEMIHCLDTMWKIFTNYVRVEQKDEIEKFLEAKERAHRLLNEIGK